MHFNWEGKQNKKIKINLKEIKQKYDKQQRYSYNRKLQM